MTSSSMSLELHAVGNTDLWVFKDRSEPLSVSVIPFDPGFVSLVAHMQIKLKGPHFDVASGFGFVSQ